MLRYLKETRTYGLTYMRADADTGDDVKVWAYSDADYTNCLYTSRSVTGFVLQLNIRFKSKTQKADM